MKQSVEATRRKRGSTTPSFSSKENNIDGKVSRKQNFLSQDGMSRSQRAHLWSSTRSKSLKDRSARSSLCGSRPPHLTAVSDSRPASKEDKAAGGREEAELDWENRRMRWRLGREKGEDQRGWEKRGTWCRIWWRSFSLVFVSFLFAPCKAFKASPNLGVKIYDNCDVYGKVSVIGREKIGRRVQSP